MDTEIEQLLTERAHVAQKNAHAPYSGFQVGAAILTHDNQIYSGCNVENAAYPQGQCAEASAIGAMVSHGSKNIKAVLIASPNNDYCFPCGGCRQKIAEFADDEIPVILVTQGAQSKTVTVGELLPYAFRLKP
ncbi:cytidine deaminase [Alteromonas pelagimontana]|uniref:Cytidine deaminase n=1 Tax=Alteromonas pelagimontana TaxID=1858656 RepID=A0A6M4MH06_9ALTE|nr:cytidine deaminase [Alteromonas pelagimontana]QJR82494.1 cytidine deaminase [Alteromonas pelagimontana]